MRESRDPGVARASTAILLRRSDPARNMHRFYRLSLEATLFGEWASVREWGRVGSPGQVRRVVCPTEADARAVFDRHLRLKERRGYVRRRPWPRADSAAAGRSNDASFWCKPLI